MTYRNRSISKYANGATLEEIGDAVEGIIESGATPEEVKESIDGLAQAVRSGMSADDVNEALNNGSVNSNLLKSTHGRIPNHYLTTSTFTGNDVGQTSCSSMQMESHFEMVRILVVQNETEEVTLGPFSAAVTEEVNNYTDAAAIDKTPVEITFDGSATITMPAVSEAGKPDYYWSDWVALKSVENVDGSGKPWLVIRAFGDISNPSWTRTANADPDLWYVDENRPWFVTYQYAETASVGNWSNYSPLFSTGNNQTMIIGAQVSSMDQGFSVMAVGDSIFNGYGSGIALQAGTWFYQAINDLSYEKGLPVSGYNYGWTGQSSDEFLYRFESDVDNVSPSAAIFESYSSNDGTPTVELINAARYRTARFVKGCRERGIVPILWTPLASSSWDSSALDLLAEYRAEVQQYKAVVLMDVAAHVINPETNTLYDEYHESGDSVHLNDAGITAILPECKRAIRQALYLSQVS